MRFDRDFWSRSLICLGDRVVSLEGLREVVDLGDLRLEELDMVGVMHCAALQSSISPRLADWKHAGSRPSIWISWSAGSAWYAGHPNPAVDPEPGSSFREDSVLCREKSIEAGDVL